MDSQYPNVHQIEHPKNTDSRVRCTSAVYRRILLDQLDSLKRQDQSCVRDFLFEAFGHVWKIKVLNRGFAKGSLGVRTFEQFKIVISIRRPTIPHSLVQI